MAYRIIWTFSNMELEKDFIGPLNKNIGLLEAELGVHLSHINNVLMLDDENATGEQLIAMEEKVAKCKAIIETLYDLSIRGVRWQERDLIHIVERFGNGSYLETIKHEILEFYQNKIVVVHTFDGKKITVKTLTQKAYIEALEQASVVFATGSAGTGKTYLAVGYAVQALKKNAIQKIIITRPAVEAGEKLGFLPGDLKEKVDPYLIPIYDALYEFLGKEAADKLIERGVIEIAPLAYMRGRTLDNAIIILDEGQNSTRNQMKMFVTRLGFHSKMIITGDTSQIDLPNKSASGLVEACQLLTGIPGIVHIQFTQYDVMRHPIVSKIIAKYEEKVDD